MARRGDPTDVDQTCPLIDEVLRFIEAVSTDNQDNEDYQKDCDRAEQVLEMIRTANSKLREFGIEQYERANKFENDFERSSNRIDELEYTIMSLEKECNSLASEINDLQSKLQDEWL